MFVCGIFFSKVVLFILSSMFPIIRIFGFFGLGCLVEGGLEPVARGFPGFFGLGLFI